MRKSLDYNNALAFGYLGLQWAKGFYDQRIVKINNMIQYLLWDYNPPGEGVPLLSGQLFTIPPAEADARYSEIGKDRKLDVLAFNNSIALIMKFRHMF